MSKIHVAVARLKTPCLKWLPERDSEKDKNIHKWMLRERKVFQQVELVSKQG